MWLSPVQSSCSPIINHQKCTQVIPTLTLATVVCKTTSLAFYKLHHFSVILVLLIQLMMGNKVIIAMVKISQLPLRSYL